VGVAHISVALQQTGFAFVQTYDQSYIAQDQSVVNIAPDFVDLYSKTDAPNPVFDPSFFPTYTVTAGVQNTCTKPPSPQPSPSPPLPSNSMPVWLIVALVCASILIVAGIVVAVYFVHRNKYGKLGMVGKVVVTGSGQNDHTAA
jgi:hypothetical protein